MFNIGNRHRNRQCLRNPCLEPVQSKQKFTCLCVIYKEIFTVFSISIGYNFLIYHIQKSSLFLGLNRHWKGVPQLMPVSYLFWCQTPSIVHCVMGTDTIQWFTSLKSGKVHCMFEKMCTLLYIGTKVIAWIYFSLFLVAPLTLYLRNSAAVASHVVHFHARISHRHVSAWHSPGQNEQKDIPRAYSIFPLAISIRGTCDLEGGNSVSSHICIYFKQSLGRPSVWNIS
jgi:hypothetical protein